ncbi:MAG: hypothetical protein ILO68_03125 [Clostridia bacterium]|nr:hypothetical protein [Clostridia bacterium]
MSKGEIIVIAILVFCVLVCGASIALGYMRASSVQEAYEYFLAKDPGYTPSIIDRAVWLAPFALLSFCAVLHAVIARGKNWWHLLPAAIFPFLFKPLLRLHGEVVNIFNQVVAGPMKMGYVSLFWIYPAFLFFVVLFVIGIDWGAESDRGPGDEKHDGVSDFLRLARWSDNY